MTLSGHVGRRWWAQINKVKYRVCQRVVGAGRKIKQRCQAFVTNGAEDTVVGRSGKASRRRGTGAEIGSESQNWTASQAEGTAGARALR